MDRLTKYNGDHGWQENHDNDSRKWRNGSRSCIEKLAAYEDTGLTPERAQELAKAEQEGRLIELPLPVGAEVFEVLTYARRPCVTKRIIELAHTNGRNYVRYETGTTTGFDAKQLGKTVFLTREEAEAALKEGK